MAEFDPETGATVDRGDAALRFDTFALRGVHCLGCAGAVERALREQPNVTEFQFDWKSDLVHAGYDPRRITPEEIEQVITQTGCDCKATEVEEHHHEAM